MTGLLRELLRKERQKLSNKKDIIFKIKNLSKLYGANKIPAFEMMKNGSEKSDVARKYGVTVAVNDVSFEVERGKIFVLIGLSGSGKSTVVRCLNLLQKPTSGDILFEGKSILKLNKKELMEFRRYKISMVFQSFGLMSHRDVLGNVAYGLEVRGEKKEICQTKAMDMIEMVGLKGWEHKRISELSGGMRQRVGIARALANNPDVLLMDEPFSALDPLVRRDMQFELLSIQKKLNKTVIFITHDINEAFKLGDLVGIMKDGKIIQIDTPEGMASNPADEYVENFINSADKGQIYSVKHIMQTPSCLIHSRDGVNYALKQMRDQGVSSAYVVDDNLRLVGILPLDNAVKVKAGELSFQDAITKDVLTTEEDVYISDLLSVAATAKYPIAVIDKENHLKGIVSKASVLSSLV
ncbi:MAG: betaine/proline/choline family ABC transporter ATP-binding protein [Clostridiaceae bacterium]|nr:betaine/proline/choline family ABC transporter ATP-binding protein [Clostridiaceae bacterium]